MSLLWPSQSVALASDSVAIIHRARGLSHAVVSQQYSVCAPQAGEPLWLAATSQFDQLLTAFELKANTELKITLASSFVRYLALPPQQVRMSSAEKFAYATAAYREIYGAAVNDWQIQLDDASPSQTTMVAAVDKKLLATLSQVAQSHQRKLKCIQPYLMAAFNGLHQQINTLNGFLVIVESDRLLLVFVKQGRCQHLRVHLLAEDWQVELKRLMMRESVLSEASDDGDTKEILIYAPAHSDVALNTIPGWKLKRVGAVNKKLNLTSLNLKSQSEHHFAMLEI